MLFFSSLLSFPRFSLSIAASGPVRLFTPYKRRRKIKQEPEENNTNGSQTVTTASAAANVTITTQAVTSSTNNSSSINNNTNIINNNNTTTQQLHIQTTPIQQQNNTNNNNNNTVTINANNGIKKKRFSLNTLNIVNMKPSGAESSDDVETENITFTPTVTAPAVKEETVTPWQTVTEAIQEIPADYVDQTCKFLH